MTRKFMSVAGIALQIGLLALTACCSSSSGGGSAPPTEVHVVVPPQETVPAE